MTTRRFTAALIGLGVAAALTGALVLSAADEADDSQPAGPPTMRIGQARQALPCYGSADAAQYWISASLASSCVRSHAYRPTSVARTPAHLPRHRRHRRALESGNRPPSVPNLRRSSS